MALIAVLLLVTLEAHRVGLEARDLLVAAHSEPLRMRQLDAVAGDAIFVLMTQSAPIPVGLRSLAVSCDPGLRVRLRLYFAASVAAIAIALGVTHAAAIRVLLSVDLNPVSSMRRRPRMLMAVRAEIAGVAVRATRARSRCLRTVLVNPVRCVRGRPCASVASVAERPVVAALAYREVLLGRRLVDCSPVVRMRHLKPVASLT